MLKVLRNLLVFTLILSLTLTALPVMTQARTVDAPVEEVTDDASVTAQEPYIISEIIEDRKPNEKHFRMSDGSYTAAVYPYDVHYQDETGALLDMDNSLITENDGEDDVFSNQKNDTFVKFMKKSNQNKLYTINSGDNKIKVAIEEVSKVDAEICETESTSEETDNPYVLSDIGRKLIYADILDNTDIEFSFVSRELKENIIIKDKVDFNSLIYNYHFNSEVSAVLQDSKTIVVTDKSTGAVVLNVCAPVMWDADGNYYDDLSLKLLEHKNNKIKVKLSWNDNGTLGDDIAYPLTIDPAMSFSNAPALIDDTYISSTQPYTVFGGYDHLRIDQGCYALVKVPILDDLYADRKIVQASLCAMPYGYYGGISSDYSNANSYSPAINITAHMINRTWNEETATYDSVGAEDNFYSSIVQSYFAVNSDTSQYNWDITKAVNQWVENPDLNNGILLKFDKAPSDGSAFDAYFLSTEHATAAANSTFPQVLYQYISSSGIEDYYSYHTQNIGYAGTAYTNDHTGNLTLINTVAQTGGSVMPVSASLVYNLCDSNDPLGPYGYGWKLNWAQRIDWSVRSNINGEQYVKYSDGDGTDHYFVEDTDTGIWSDEINPDRKIYFDESSGDYRMTDSSGINMYFTRNGTLNEWHLYKVVDTYGNYTQIILSSANLDRVVMVYSSTGNTINFTYGTDELLNSISYVLENGTTKYINLSYTGGCLTGISYPDGTSVSYNYISGTKNLSRAYDITGQSFFYDYSYGDGYNVGNKVTGVTEYSSTNELGARMNMSYEATATLIEDVNFSRKYLYTFSVTGTPKSAVDITGNDGNGYAQYYEYNNGNTEVTNGKGNLTFLSKNQKSTVNILKNHSFESNAEVSFIAWNETTATASGGYSTEKHHIGSRSYKITRPTTSDSTRALGFYYLYLDGGKTYTLSAYVNTADMVSTGKGASVLFIGNNSGTFESEYITETKDEWQRVSVTFKPNYSEYVSICMSLYGATGSVYFDNIQLEVGELSEYNLLENAGFEQGYDGTVPLYWSRWYVPVYADTQVKIGGAQSARLYGTANTSPELLQVLTIPDGKAGDTYVASAFAKADSIPADGWKFTLLVRFLKSGATVNEENILFNPHTTEWQKVAGAASASGDYDAIQFYLLYYGNCNTVYFDNAQLVKDTFGTAYTYDSNGNLLTTVDLQGKDEYTFKYDGNNQLIRQSNLSGSKILYSYDYANPHQLDVALSNGLSTTYTYDSYGNALTTSTDGGELVDGQYYYLRNTYYNKCVDDHNWGTTNGTNVQLMDYSRNTAQHWKLIKNTDGSYSLSPECAPGMLLSVEGGLANNANLALYAAGAATYQKFALINYYGNFYRLAVFENQNYSVDANGSNCHIYSTHGGEIQQFALIPVEGTTSAQNPSLNSSATYSSNGEYMTAMTDSTGATTTYDYEQKRGLLQSTTNYGGYTTEYDYYLSEQLKSVTADIGDGATAQARYNYNSKKQLSSIISPSLTQYNFTYDNFGRTTEISVGEETPRTLSYYSYNETTGLLDYMIYGTGIYTTYYYDDLGRQTGVDIDGVLRFQTTYDGASRISEVLDILAGKKTKYSYDILGRAVSEKTINTATNTVIAQQNIRYDDNLNRTIGYDTNIEGISHSTDYVYGGTELSPDIISGVKLNGTQKLSYTFDSLNRLSTKTYATSTPFVTQYTYNTNSAMRGARGLLKKLTYGNNTIEYYYDTLGNITNIKTNGVYGDSYTYDGLGQLTHVNDGSSIWEYFYDLGGNLSEVWKDDVLVEEYEYEDPQWEDLLTKFNGQTITYDTIGNPTTYRDGFDFSWRDGRKLEFVMKNKATLAGYTYNADGLRTEKIVNGVKTEYYWMGGVLQAQKTGSEYIIFLYDESGTPYGLLLKNGATEQYYYYVYNGQGDIIAIVDSTGVIVVEYTYGIWGEVESITGSMSSTIGQKNPLRYRGYYYDEETGFYYLQSRYYDPVVRRFINADALLATNDILGFNLFSYCGNNPVNNIDPDGHFWKSIKDWTVKTYNKIKDGVVKAYNNIKEFAQKTFTNRKEIAKSAVTSLELEVSSGFGIGGQTSISGVGVDSYAKALMPKGVISDTPSLDVTFEFAINCDFTIFEFGPNYIFYDDPYKPPEQSFFRVKDSFTLMEFEVFVLYGFGYSLDFNIDKFINKVSVFYE